ncbi:Kelch domain-containing protein 4 [Thelohanellus kitauei]|uniref:Kelch domain-containing protein 4 n=1 Tax=Thelohanellus kitauei TaxID=669202 RepID=A0A0C2N8A2_THEKT|nr:Kelch domain-containing protein 4 [Thelohanellus kitauei]
MSPGNDRIYPESRVRHCMTSVREFLIIYGGYENFSGAECNELWSYNTKSDVWLQYIPPSEIKDTCVSSSICSFGNLVYIFGGDSFDGENYRQTNSIVSFDITNATWDVVYPHTDDYNPNTPPPMCENLLLYHDGFLYVLGGYHESLNLDTIYKYCLKSSKWSKVQQTGIKPTFNRQISGTFYKNQ